MLHKFLSIYWKGSVPAFRNLQITDLHRKPKLMLKSPYFYTPRVQKLTFTPQLAKYCRFLQRKQTVTPEDMKQFAQNMIAQFNFIINGYQQQSIQNQKQTNRQHCSQPQFKNLNKDNKQLFEQTSLQSKESIQTYNQKNQVKLGVIKNFNIKNNNSSPYWGCVDWLIYLDQLHFFPMMFFEKQLNPSAGAGMAFSNMITRNQAKERYSDPKIKNKNYSGYSLITTGQQWQLFKMQSDLSLQKSIIYEAKTTPKNKFRNIYSDHQMIATCLGLFQQCLDIKQHDIRLLALQKAYQYLDQQRFMSQNDKQLTRVGKLILKLQNKDPLK